MEAAARTLYDCAVNGDIAMFRRLVEQDDSILERLTVPLAGKSKEENVLHVAASFGHAEFMETVLSYKPELSTERNEEGFTPLHVASSRGHVEACRVILEADPDAALSKDNDGRIPAHHAAMKGKLGALQEIVAVNPWCVKDRTAKGETVLHLSVKYNRVEVVMFLLRLEEVREMVNDGDGNGNTVLHLAAARKQKEMLTSLLGSGLPVDLNAVNGFGVNPFQLFCRRWSPSANDDIRNRLTPNQQYPCRDQPHGIMDVPASELAAAASTEPWMKQSENVMLVAILIATVTFQAGLTPPGGLWQDSGTDAAAGIRSPVAPASAPVDSHAAGTAILSSGPYDKFMFYNTGAFAFSLMALLFHLVMKTSFVSRRGAVLGWAFTMLMAVVFLAVAFYNGIAATQPKGSHASNTYQTYLVFWLVGFAGGLGICFLISRIVMHYRKIKITTNND